LLIIEDTLVSDNDQIVEEKFVERVKDLGVDTKDALLHTVANVQHALEIAGDYIRTQLSSIPSETIQRWIEQLQKEIRRIFEQLSTISVTDNNQNSIIRLIKVHEQGVSHSSINTSVSSTVKTMNHERFDQVFGRGERTQ